MQTDGTKWLTTSEAADKLRRKARTLHRWACYDTGPVKPIKVNGRLLWSLDQISRLLDSEECSR